MMAAPLVKEELSKYSTNFNQKNCLIIRHTLQMRALRHERF